MIRLRDLISREDKFKLSNFNTKPGQVIVLYCPFTFPIAKNKFTILLSDNPHPLLFMINSKPRLIRRSPKLDNTQIKIESSMYGFLSHDSFINCNEVIKDFSLADIYQQVSDDPSRIKGELVRETKLNIRQVVESSITITDIDKSNILDNFL